MLSIPSAIPSGLLAALVEPATPGATGPGLALLTMLMLLGLVLLTSAGALILLGARRRRRSRRTLAPPKGPTPDPWSESAARLEPPAWQDEEPAGPHG